MNHPPLLILTDHGLEASGMISNHWPKISSPKKIRIGDNDHLEKLRDNLIYKIAKERVRSPELRWGLAIIGELEHQGDHYVQGR